jgi:hypothetical protein
LPYVLHDVNVEVRVPASFVNLAWFHEQVVAGG